VRLASADTLPIDPSAYAVRLREFALELRRRVPPAPPANAAQAGLDEVDAAIEALTAACAAFERERDAALSSNDPHGLGSVNVRLLRFERSFLSPDGIPRRPWYRHLVYAPKFTYAPEIFPGVAEALDRRDWTAASHQGRELAAAIRRAAAALHRE
jgi:N-acetylated-alpha-linked acidic dipeptidase